MKRVALATLLVPSLLLLSCSGSGTPGNTPGPTDPRDAGVAARDFGGAEPSSGCTPGGPCIDPSQAPFVLRSSTDQALVWVRGSGFGESGRLLLDGIETPSQSWSPELVTFTAPDPPPGDGLLWIETGERSSNHLPFASAPRPARIVQERVEPDEIITIEGEAFGNSTGRVDVVKKNLGHVPVVNIERWTPTSIDVRLDKNSRGAAEFRVVKLLWNGDVASGELPADETLPFLVVPKIVSPPRRVAYGARIELLLLGDQTDAKVLIGGVPADTYGGEGSGLYVPPSVPPGETSLVVVNPDGGRSAPQPLTVLAWQLGGLRGAKFRLRSALDAGKFAPMVGTVDTASHEITLRLYDHEHFSWAETRCRNAPTPPADGPEVAVDFAVPFSGKPYLLANEMAPGFVEAPSVAVWRCTHSNGVDQWVRVARWEPAQDEHLRPVGLAATRDDLYAAARDPGAEITQIWRWNKTWRDPELEAFDAFTSTGATGRLRAAGSELYLAGGDGPWDGSLWRLVGSSFEAVPSPWSGPVAGLGFTPLFAGDPTGRLWTVVKAGGAFTLAAYAPALGAWTELTPQGLDHRVPRALHPNADGSVELLEIREDPAGGQSLFARRWDPTTSAWVDLYEDLAEVPGCPLELGRVALIHGFDDHPMAFFEVPAPSCASSQATANVIDGGLFSAELVLP